MRHALTPDQIAVLRMARDRQGGVPWPTETLPVFRDICLLVVLKLLRPREGSGYELSSMGNHYLRRISEAEGG
jgi:hypothetical protein